MRPHVLAWPCEAQLGSRGWLADGEHNCYRSGAGRMVGSKLLSGGWREEAVAAQKESVAGAGFMLKVDSHNRIEVVKLALWPYPF